MGRPVKTPSTRPRVARGDSRRDFFRRSGSAAVALAAVPAVALEGAPRAVPAATAPFQHGVASGDPHARGVILWTRVSVPTAAERAGDPASARGGVRVDYRVATDPALADVVLRGSARTGPERDHTVKIDVSGLKPDRTYYYRFDALGAASPIGRTKTLPAGAAPRLRMAVVSCSNLAYGYFNAYGRIAERADLDLVVHLGDYLYEYGPGEYGSVRTPEPPKEILTLADYRARHAQYKRDVDLQAVHRQHPFIAIWDDHEVANDSYEDGAQNHTEGPEGTWTDRVNAALQAYYEWMPVRVVDPANLRKNNRSFRYGNLVELVMLEERLNARSKQLPTEPLPPPLNAGFTQTGAYLDPARTLLGSEENDWLATTLRGSTARWKFIGQGVMFAQLKGVGAANQAGGGVFLNPDQWDGYQPQRDLVYGILKGDGQHAPVDDVVVLTGDIHSSWAADLTQDPNNPDVAGGGYDPATGAGAHAVEFVGTSITSPGIDDPSGATAAFLRSVNPHFGYIELNKRGYLLLDATRERVVCEWWYVDTVAAPSRIETFGVAFEVKSGTHHLVPSVQTTPRPKPPAPAP